MPPLLHCCPRKVQDKRVKVFYLGNDKVVIFIHRKNKEDSWDHGCVR